MKEATKRSIFRWVHLIFVTPIIGYIYSPLKELPNCAPLVGTSPFRQLPYRDPAALARQEYQQDERNEP
jgi:hypothetical protein